MDKKGQFTKTVDRILMVVGFLVLLGLLAIIFFNLNSELPDEACYASAYAQSKTDLKLVKDSPVDLNCPEKFIIIKNREVLAGYDPKHLKAEQVMENNNKVSRYSKLSDKITNQVFSQEMYNCFKKLGAGNIEVFRFDFFKVYQNVCLRCAQISFDSNVNTFSTLQQYLEQNKPVNQNISYFDYLHPGMTINKKPDVVAKYSSQYDGISTGKTYIVTFRKSIDVVADSARKIGSDVPYIYEVNVYTPETIGQNCDYEAS